jgi:hypothetical protein
MITFNLVQWRASRISTIESGGVGNYVNGKDRPMYIVC